MAGGRWIAQNKIRPGAYINFKSVPRGLNMVGDRGILTFPMTMSWGPTDQLIELFSTDLIDGTSVEKIGLTAYDAGSLPYRAALSNAYKAWVYRINAEGTPATATADGLTVTAKYGGVMGNNIKFAVIASTTPAGSFDVVTFYNNGEEDRQNVTTIAGLIDNDWVKFTGEGTLTPTAEAGVPLVGGTDGEIDTANFAEYIRLLQGVQWNTMAVQYDTQTFIDAAVQYITDLRENRGIARQLVVNNTNAANYEGVISAKGQGYQTANETFDPEIFVLWLGGLEAGSDINSSRTYFEIPGATRIINPLTDDEIEQALKDGYVVLSVRQDGAIVIEQDINTLHTFTVDKNSEFGKNRVIRTLDEINNTLSLIFQRSYIGKVNNNQLGRDQYKADCISYLSGLEDAGAIQNFDPTNDIVVSPGIQPEGVVVDLAIWVVDSMEKLYMTVMVRVG